MKSVNRKPLSVIVYESLKSAIINGEIEAGSRLTETVVSTQLNVSSTPVREAFTRLSSEGLVKIVPWRGAIVQEFTSQQLLEAYECREALETMAVKLAAQKITDNEIEKLQAIFADAEKTEDQTTFAELNTELHKLIFEYANNQTLTDMISQINDVILNHRNISSYSSSRRKQILKEHSEMIAALSKRDSEKAAYAIQKHIQNGYQYILDRKNGEA